MDPGANVTEGNMGPNWIRTLNPKVDRHALYLTELKGTSLQALACSSVSLLHTHAWVRFFTSGQDKGLKSPQI
jgi:hypothetical protein